MTNRTGTIALLAAALLAACGGGDETTPDATGDTATAAVQPAPAADSAAPAATGGMVDPNTATREQLAAVPGLSPAAVDALIAGRPYADMRGVDSVLSAAQVDSAGREAAFATLWKPLDLNRASAEEIELIPGVGPRMRHEFEEYRPYTDMAQFRREIGKYVDEAEVARLEKYVTLGQ